MKRLHSVEPSTLRRRLPICLTTDVQAVGSAGTSISAAMPFELEQTGYDQMLKRRRDVRDARSVCRELLRPAALAAANAAEHERDRFAARLLHAIPLPAKQIPRFLRAYSCGAVPDFHRLPVHQMRKLYFRNSLPSQVNDALGSVLKLAIARKHGPRFSFALCLMWQAWDINASAHLWSRRQSFWLHPRWRWQESTRAVRSIDGIQVFRPE